MDWDSSGSTTILTMMLKKISWSNSNYNFLVLGGKGRDGINIPNEIIEAKKRFDLENDNARYLEYISRISAKIDNILLQDGYTLYQQALFITREGYWSIVQQGMNISIKMTRRYHLSKDSFDLDNLNTHTAIASDRITRPLNLIDKGSKEVLKIIGDITVEKVTRITEYINQVNAILKGYSLLTNYNDKIIKIDRDYITAIDYYKPIKVTKELINSINRIQMEGSKKIIEALAIKGVGANTIRALALVADLIYGYRPSNTDPVTHPIDPFRYAYAHGGKDGVPYRINKRLLEHTIAMLEEAVNKAKLGDKDKLLSLRRLAKLAKEYRL